MTRLRVAVVDDEAPARMLLREFLDGDPDVDVVAECANGFEAVKAVAELRPDVLFLDVQMPKLDGFEVLDLVSRDVAVVFTTAYDEYALRAFEVHAVDYLLKPFGRERLVEALGRVRVRLAARGAAHSPTASGTFPAGPASPDSVAPGAASLSAAARAPGTWLTRIVIRDGADVHVIPIDRVDYVEAQDDYIAVHAGERPRLKEQTLASLEAQLDPRRFVRIHRSYLLNLDRLARLESVGKDTRMAILRDGRRLPVSRAGFTRLQELL
ncbi:MAG: LytR/AlgR family response regulator transcription factor [Vicinamibacterales bacterium]